VGRHAASGGDGSDRGSAPVPHGRRRTDVLDAGRPADLSDSPTTPGRSRADRRREGLLPVGEDPVRRRPGGVRPVPPAAGPPVRPVPASARPKPPAPTPMTRPRLPVPPAAPPPQAPPVVGPRTTVAPFQAVPTPGHGTEDTDQGRAAPPEHDAAAPLEPGASWSEGRPVVQSGDPAPGYGDWTNPSRTRRPAAPPTEAIPDRDTTRGADRAAGVRSPATQAIPDRSTARSADTGAGYAVGYDTGEGAYDTGEAGYDSGYDTGDTGYDTGEAGYDTGERPLPVDEPPTGPSTGVVGGRAAFRAERQAAEIERRKAARRTGGSTAARLDGDPGRRGGGVRRAAAGLLAVAVVALLVLGVYSFMGGDAQEASDTTPAPSPSTSATPSAPPSGALPPLEVEPLPADEGAAAPVQLPVTVLNATQVQGLAARVADEIATQGWESPGVGAYTGGDVAATTVFYTPGDETQRRSAELLIEQFPDIRGPAERFFEVPDVAAPGLVLVATGEWQP
jgi:LytR cell envelope-related transcriptional attenuator